jgi:hypothetical protein
MTSVSKEYLSMLKVPFDSKPNLVVSDESDDELDEKSDDDADSSDYDPENDIEDNIAPIELDNCFDDGGDFRLQAWFEGIKRDPLNRARRIIHFLRSSDTRRTDFHQFIEDGNQQKWFYTRNEHGKSELTMVPQLQLLRDVKTRWDSVYLMLQRLRVLRPVSSSLILCDWRD